MNRSVNKLTVKLVRKGYSVMTGMHQMKDGTQVMAFDVKKNGMPPLVLPLDFIRASVEKLGIEETLKQYEEIFETPTSEGPEEELDDKPYVVRLKDGEMHAETIE